MNEFDDQISDALRSHAAHIEVQPAGFGDVRRRAHLRRARFAGLAVVPVLVAAAYVSGATRSNRTDIGVASDGAPTSEAAADTTALTCLPGTLVPTWGEGEGIIVGTVGTVSTTVIAGDTPPMVPSEPQTTIAIINGIVQGTEPLATTTPIPAIAAETSTTSVIGEAVGGTPVTALGQLVGSGVVSVGGTTGTLVDGQTIIVSGDAVGGQSVTVSGATAEPCLTVDVNGATGTTECVVVGTVETTVPSDADVPTTSASAGPATTTTTVVLAPPAEGAAGSGVTSYVSNGSTMWACTGSTGTTCIIGASPTPADLVPTTAVEGTTPNWATGALTCATAEQSPVPAPTTSIVD